MIKHSQVSNHRADADADPSRTRSILMSPTSPMRAFILPSLFCPPCQIRQSFCPQTRPARCVPISNQQSLPSPASKQNDSKSRSDRLVLVGLGNPGPNYANTRHNIGFEIVDEFVKRNGKVPFTQDKRFKADIATLSVSNSTVHVVKPRTFMNESGIAVRAIMSFYKLPVESLLVVTDDLAQEVGCIRVRAKGSPGGHNGLRSIEKHVGTRSYARLKIGVGAPHDGSTGWRDHVLGSFSRGEQDMLIDVTWECMDVLEHWVCEPDIDKVISKAALQQWRGKRN